MDILNINSTYKWIKIEVIPQRQLNTPFLYIEPDIKFMKSNLNHREQSNDNVKYPEIGLIHE